ncbi:MAG: hypothetical protein K1X86_00270 [Ignavibacteria bacterium]|nr:hypothetical protein [Ignavibacteria bacterium]
MKKIIFVIFILINGGFCFSQNKIFLPSEESWVTIIEFSDCNEDNPDNYLGKYKFVHPAEDDKGQYYGDGYNDIKFVGKILGKLFVYSYGEVEGWSEPETDTMKNPSIQKNYLLSDNQNLLIDVPKSHAYKFTTLEYKNKKGKIKKTKGILDMYEGDELYFYEIIENSAQENKEKNNAMVDDIGKKISALIPSKAYLREYEKLLDVKEEVYLGLYITEFKDPVIPVTPIFQYDPQNLFSNCPEMTQGQSVTGKYFLFAYKNNQIISQVQIPANVYDSNEECSISLYNTPYNNCNYFSFLNKNCKGSATNNLELTKLIQLLDLTGDKKYNEFILTGIQEACGFIDRLSCGFDEETQQVLVYPITEHNEKYYWMPRFVPFDGECSVVIICDDHGNDEYSRSDYKFNPSTKQYELVYELKEECK